MFEIGSCGSQGLGVTRCHEGDGCRECGDGQEGAGCRAVNRKMDI